MAEFVKFSVPEDLKNLQADVISKVSKSGKIKVGINEVTKTIERNTAKLVVIAQDISPAEIVMHVPIICKEKSIPFTYVSTREELGKISGIGAKASAIAIVDEGVLKKEFSALLSKIEEISGVTAKSKPEAKEEKPKAADKKPAAEKKPVAKKEVAEKKE
jgi:large subunit ribosomal protein L7Ae